MSIWLLRHISTKNAISRRKRYKSILPTKLLFLKVNPFTIILLHSEQPELYGVLAVLSAIGLRKVTKLGKNVDSLTKKKLFEVEQVKMY